MTRHPGSDIDEHTYAAYRDLEVSAGALGLSLVCDITPTGWQIFYLVNELSGLLADGPDLAAATRDASAVIHAAKLTDQMTR